MWFAAREELLVFHCKHIRVLLHNCVSRIGAIILGSIIIDYQQESKPINI